MLQEAILPGDIIRSDPGMIPKLGVKAVYLKPKELRDGRRSIRSARLRWSSIDPEPYEVPGESPISVPVWGIGG